MKMEESEIWKDINGYEGLYQVSSLGRVKSLKKTVSHPRSVTITYPERIIKGSYCNGYSLVTLCKNGKSKTCLRHRLVALAFIYNPENKKEVNHIDYNRSNNSVSNLEWCTSSENKKHSKHMYRGSNNKNSKLKEHDVYKIKALLAIKQKSKMTYSDIGNMFNVSSDCIQKISSNKHWKQI